mgnify:FL=1
MVHKETIKDWTGKILGFVETDSRTGNKIIRDFYGRIKGKYDKKLNVTRDFYGRKVANGDQLLMMLNR